MLNVGHRHGVHVRAELRIHAELLGRVSHRNAENEFKKGEEEQHLAEEVHLVTVGLREEERNEEQFYVRTEECSSQNVNEFGVINTSFAGRKRLHEW